MSKVLVFTFDHGTPGGGLSDLRNVFETDNREAKPVTDADGYLLPEILQEIARRRANPGCIQALHLGGQGQPQRQEEWQRVRAKPQPVALDERLAPAEAGYSYLRVRAGLCVLGATG